MQEETKMTGYPSIDKPWLKYYSEEEICSPLPEMTIYEYLWQCGKTHLNDTAIIFEGKKITYEKLFANIDKAARAFQAIGVQRDDVVAVLSLNQPEMVYAFYALNKIGAVVCVVNVLSSAKELVHYLRESKAKFFLALDIFFDNAYKAAKEYGIEKLIYLPLFESLGWLKKAGYRMKVHVPQVKDDAVLSWSEFIKAGERIQTISQAEYQKGKCSVIGHSGGTTGTPKGIMLSDQAVNAILSQYQSKFNYSRKDTFLSLIVPFAVYGLVINLHLPLCFGMTVILIPKVDQKETDKLLLKYRPNHVASIPDYWRALLAHKEPMDLSWLKTAAAGGAGMTVEMEEQLNHLFERSGAKIHFLNGYGMSEVGSTACTQLAEIAEVGSVGIPLVKNVIAAFDENQNEMKYGEEGEICISTPSVMLGYLENPTETAETLRVHKDGKVWVHTGDVGYINQNGSVFIKGRMKRIYLTQQGGTISKIFPDRIEKTILSCQGVASCCVVCVQNREKTYVPIAYIILNEASLGEEDAIKERLSNICLEELPQYAQPVFYQFCQSLPLTAVGKTDYRKLETESKSLFQ